MAMTKRGMLSLLRDMFSRDEFWAPRAYVSLSEKNVLTIGFNCEVPRNRYGASPIETKFLDRVRTLVAKGGYEISEYGEGYLVDVPAVMPPRY